MPRLNPCVLSPPSRPFRPDSLNASVDGKRNFLTLMTARGGLFGDRGLILYHKKLLDIAKPILAEEDFVADKKGRGPERAAFD